MKNRLVRFAVNLAGPVREETLDGKDYLVVPCAMMAEGIWAGSEGPVFYSEEELDNACPSWNHKPVVVGHPRDEDGDPVSASDPYVIENQQVGFLLNTKWEDDKQRTEAWLDKEKCDKVDKRILKRIKKGKKVETSTGLYIDDVQVKNEVEYNGKKTKTVARNHRPDHLAILLDKTGAYSVEDGGGLLANEEGKTFPLATNELSFNDRYSAISQQLEDKFKQPGYYWNGYLCDVYEAYFVYRMDGKYYRMDYTIKDDVVTITGEPMEVARVTEYRLATNDAYVGSSDGEFVSNQEKHMAVLKKKKEKVKFDRKAHIKGLIANGGWDEKDREELEKMSDNALSKIKFGLPDEEEEEEEEEEVVVNEDEDDEEEVEEEEQPKKKSKIKVNQKKKEKVVVNEDEDDEEEEAPQKVKTRKGLVTINDLDPDLRKRLKRAEARDRAIKDRLVQRIVSNERNRFTEKYLQNREIEELEGIAALLGDDEDDGDRVLNDGPYAGSAGAPPTRNQQVEQEPLLLNEDVDYTKLTVMKS